MLFQRTLKSSPPEIPMSRFFFCFRIENTRRSYPHINVKHTRWFCYDHTPTTSSLKLWKATTIPLLRNGTKSIGYLLPLERMKGIEPSSPTWKEGVMTIIRHSRFGWNQTRSVHRDLVVDFRQSGTRHFCVLSWI